MSPPGPIRVVSFGRRGVSGFGPAVGYAGFSSVLGRSHPNWDATVVGRARGQVPVANLMRVCGVARSRELECPASPWSAACVRPSGRGYEKRKREGVGKPIPRRSGRALKRRRETQESIDPAGLRPGRARIPAGSNALELRGIVIFWSSEQKSAMSETARGPRRRKAYGPAGGESSEG
jgi:hypothetical protein